MLRTVLLCACGLLSLHVPKLPEAEDPPGVKERFEALDEARDHSAVVALWRAHPAETLQVIDSYLEGSLAKVEAGVDADAAAIRDMHARAQRGARAADEAFGRAIFGDYVSSFVGWDPQERIRFRKGQRAFGACRKASKSGHHDLALESARECVDLAEPLGDWWGTAMGLGGVGDALVALGRHREAVAPLSRARLLNQQLGLVGSEYRVLKSLCTALTRTGKRARARVALERAEELGKRLGDASGLRELAALRETLRDRERAR